MNQVKIKHPLVKRTNKRLIPFPWIGGKATHIEWILSLLPKSLHYCEPFGGSAAILLNKEPSQIETYNDIDSEIVNFFKVLRDHKNEFMESLTSTPYSSEEFVKTLVIDPDLDKIERARRFFIRARCIRSGISSLSNTGNCSVSKNTTCEYISNCISRWFNSTEYLPEIVQRLLRVQIENRDAVELIKYYDSKNTLFYCDPPYIYDPRNSDNLYRYEITDDQHRELAEVLNSVKGQVAISGYECDLMNELYPEKRWHKTRSVPKKITSSKKFVLRTEVVWTNYDPYKAVGLLF